jgi:hypothetical protein
MWIVSSVIAKLVPRIYVFPHKLGRPQSQIPNPRTRFRKMIQNHGQKSPIWDKEVAIFGPSNPQKSADGISVRGPEMGIQDTSNSISKVILAGDKGIDEYLLVM